MKTTAGELSPVGCVLVKQIIVKPGLNALYDQAATSNFLSKNNLNMWSQDADSNPGPNMARLEATELAAAERL